MQCCDTWRPHLHTFISTLSFFSPCVCLRIPALWPQCTTASLSKAHANIYMIKYNMVFLCDRIQSPMPPFIFVCEIIYIVIKYYIVTYATNIPTQLVCFITHSHTHTIFYISHFNRTAMAIIKHTRNFHSVSFFCSFSISFISKI